MLIKLQGRTDAFLQLYFGTLTVRNTFNTPTPPRTIDDRCTQTCTTVQPGADHKPVLEKLAAKLEGYKLRFNKYDADGSGDLDLDELQRMLRQMETSLSK